MSDFDPKTKLQRASLAEALQKLGWGDGAAVPSQKKAIADLEKGRMGKKGKMALPPVVKASTLLS